MTDSAYAIGAPLGGGGTATVRRGSRAGDGRVLALKRAHDTPTAAAALDHEAQVLELLATAGAINVVRLVGRVTAGRGGSSPVPTLVLEPVGTPLASVLAVATDQALLDARSITTILLDLADALGSVHAAGVVHRDVSPANVVIADDGRAILIDFAAAGFGPAPAAPVVGTAPYIAPEVLLGGHAGPQADLYALGVLGAVLWLGRDPATVDPDDLVAHGCPAAVAAVLARAASKRPGDRPSSACELADVLRAEGTARHRPLCPAARSSRPASTTPLAITRPFGPPAAVGPRPSTPRHRWGSRRRMCAGALALGLIGAACVGGRTVTGRPDGARDQPVDLAAAHTDAAPGVAWNSERAEATLTTPTGVTRYQLGQPGDHLLLGDWDGDGTPSPALYRPATGELFLFDAWAEHDKPEPSASAFQTGVREGRPAVHRDGTHDVVEVAVATGP